MKANEHQVGGSHYGGQKLQHWDIVDMFKLDYFQGQITKYIMRWRKKNGVEDLEKAKHFLEKYIELESGKPSSPGFVSAPPDERNDLQVPARIYGKSPERIFGDIAFGNPYVFFTPKEALPQGWTIEGYVIRDDKPMQFYRCPKCRREEIAVTAKDALHHHIASFTCDGLPRSPLEPLAQAAGALVPTTPSDGAKTLQDAPDKQSESAGAGQPGAAYTNQGD